MTGHDDATAQTGVVSTARRLGTAALELPLSDDQRARVTTALERLDGPLRVAIAGRIKAGKSTLLNSLVGERVAPTDAGECTRIVSWYREGIRYAVTAEMVDGEERSLDFRRGDRLEVDLAELSPDDVRRLLVDWPSDRLSVTTLIDTPGLSSLDRTVSDRTRDALAADGRGTPDADAVIYLMRHLHSVDADFLDGFVTGSDMGASPVNSIAVLSRADEIGAGRLDAMESARSVAAVYEGDGRMSTLTSRVVAVAGLVAETAQTLTEHEFTWLRSLAGLDDDLVAAIQLSVDRFASYEADRIAAECAVDAPARAALVERLGLFGVRFALDRIRRGNVTSTGQLAAALLVASGLDDLRAALDQRIRPRASVLQARSALLVLADVADELAVEHPDAARSLVRSLEEAAATAHEFAELRLAHVVSSGLTGLARPDVDRAVRLATPATVTDRLGVSPNLDVGDVSSAALGEVGHWRTLAANPSYDPLTVEVCEIAARCAEGIYAGLSPER